MTTHSSTTTTTTTPSPTTPQVAEPPRFAKGDRVRLRERDWLMHYHSQPHAPALDAFVVAGRGGVIMQMRQNKRTGIRSYQVMFNLGDAWGREAMYIREEHLVMLEAAHPAPETPQKPQPRQHAYEVDSIRVKLDRATNVGDIWCDASRCFMLFCPVCRAHEGMDAQGNLQSQSSAYQPPLRSHSTHEHHWQAFGSDARFEFCAGCHATQRTDRISDNPGVRLYGAARGDSTNERCVTCAYAVEMQKHYDHWFECTQDPQHGYRHQLTLTWPACARWTLKADLKRGGKKDEGEQ